MTHIHTDSIYEKEFLSLFSAFTTSRFPWQIWEAFIDLFACSLSIPTETDEKRRNTLIKLYDRALEFLNNDKNTAGKMMSLVVDAFEENPEQDFLGSLFMKLELGSHWHGQFFTPYNVCSMMASMTFNLDSAARKANDNGYVTVNDPACGAGATLIAGINLLRKHGINYQSSVLVTGYDIDRIAAEMCFIQLSLLGAAGYVVVTDTLSCPPTGNILIPDVSSCRYCFYTPMYSMNPVWVKRRNNVINMAAGVDSVMEAV